MSANGFVAVGRTLREIHQITQAARDELALGLTGRLACDMEWLLEKRIRPFRQVEIDVVSDNDTDLVDAYACYNANSRVLRIREGVLRRASQEDPDAIFTVLHEIGHIYLHSDPVHFRRTQPNHLPRKICDPEWQADMFGIDFSVDRALLQTHQTPLQAARYFRLPLAQMQKYFDQLWKDGVLVRQKTTAMDQHFDRVIQGELDLDF